MEPIAYGALGLTPWEFGSLTVTEFLKMVKGYQWRQEQERLARVYLAVPIINACARNLKKTDYPRNITRVRSTKKDARKRRARKIGTRVERRIINAQKEMG